MAESGLTPARALPDHWQARFAQRLYAMLSGLWKMWSVLCFLSCLGRVPAPLCTPVLAWPTSDAKVCHCFSLVPTQHARLQNGGGQRKSSRGKTPVSPGGSVPRPVPGRERLWSPSVGRGQSLPGTLLHRPRGTGTGDGPELED